MSVKPSPSGQAPGSGTQDGQASAGSGPEAEERAAAGAPDEGPARPEAGAAGGVEAGGAGRGDAGPDPEGGGGAEGRGAGGAQGDGGPSAESLASAARAAGGRGAPPVHLWDPPFCGDLDIRIARDGTWFYLGTPIGRPELVRLFAGILRKDGEAYFLVTPVEKVGITVEDAPFVAVDFERDAAGDLAFVTNVGDVAVAGPEHPIRVLRDPATGEPAPYVLIRRNLEALIDRKSFYRLVELGEEAPHEGEDWFGLRSGGMFFPVIPAAELPRD